MNTTTLLIMGGSLLAAAALPVIDALQDKKFKYGQYLPPTFPSPKFYWWYWRNRWLPEPRIYRIRYTENGVERTTKELWTFGEWCRYCNALPCNMKVELIDDRFGHVHYTRMPFVR